jgi:hypothetical protein
MVPRQRMSREQLLRRTTGTSRVFAQAVRSGRRGVAAPVLHRRTCHSSCGSSNCCCGGANRYVAALRTWARLPCANTLCGYRRTACKSVPVQLEAAAEVNAAIERFISQSSAGGIGAAYLGADTSPSRDSRFRPFSSADARARSSLTDESDKFRSRLNSRYMCRRFCSQRYVRHLTAEICRLAPCTERRVYSSRHGKHCRRPAIRLDLLHTRFPLLCADIYQAVNIALKPGWQRGSRAESRQRTRRRFAEDAKGGGSCGRVRGATVGSIRQTRWMGSAAFVNHRGFLASAVFDTGILSGRPLPAYWGNPTPLPKKRCDAHLTTMSATAQMAPHCTTVRRTPTRMAAMSSTWNAVMKVAS